MTIITITLRSLGIIAALVLTSCSPDDEDEGTKVPADQNTGRPTSGAEVHGKRLARIWHEDSGTPIENVPTPDGFVISPAQAYNPLRTTTSRPIDSSQWHLFADSDNYYIVERRDLPAESGEMLVVPKHSTVIDGTSGRMSRYTEE